MIALADVPVYKVIEFILLEVNASIVIVTSLIAYEIAVLVDIVATEAYLFLPHFT